MKEYIKPAIVVSEDLAESVYMASGSADVVGGSSAGQGAVSAKCVINSSYDKQAWFNVTVSNNSDADIEGWSASITFSGTVKSAEVSGCTVAISGNTITFTPSYDWNNTLRANGTYSTSGSVIGDTMLSPV